MSKTNTVAKEVQEQEVTAPSGDVKLKGNELLKSKLSQDQIQTLSEMTTWASKIRYLTQLGWARGDIARGLGKLYQHVRNVQITPLKGTSS